MGGTSPPKGVPRSILGVGNTNVGMQNMAMQPHPDGKTLPNFVNPDTVGPQTIAIVSTFLGIAVLVVALRLWTRVKIVKRTGLDDAAAVIALGLNAAGVGVYIFRKCLVYLHLLVL